MKKFKWEIFFVILWLVIFIIIFILDWYKTIILINSIGYLISISIALFAIYIAIIIGKSSNNSLDEIKKAADEIKNSINKIQELLYEIDKENTTKENKIIENKESKKQIKNGIKLYEYELKYNN